MKSRAPTKKKPKKCQVCRNTYMPFSTLQKACSQSCALTLAQAQIAKERRQETRRMRENAKTKPDLIREAQNKAFNPYIRLRDKDEPCISCGRYDHEIIGSYTKGKWDCGHYISRGAETAIRFHPMNAHKQCKTCNISSKKYVQQGRKIEQQYRENLIKKIGIKNVEWLEGPHQTQNWTHDDLREIRKHYADLTKQLKREAHNQEVKL